MDEEQNKPLLHHPTNHVTTNTHQRQGQDASRSLTMDEENNNNNDNRPPSSSNDDNVGGGPSEKEGEEHGREPDPPASAKMTTTTTKKTTTEARNNMNSRHGNRIGILQTSSLILNAGLMLYAHLGLSAVIFSSQDPSITAAANNAESAADAADGDSAADGDADAMGDAKCDSDDVATWIADGGEETRAVHSNYCSREYERATTGPNNAGAASFGCFLDVGCIEECFRLEYGYSGSCSECFGKIPGCSIQSGCIGVCAADSLGPECQECNAPCIAELGNCTGLPEVNSNATETKPETNETTTSPPTDNDADAAGAQTTSQCNDFDLGAIEEWYPVYDLTFVGSIRDAWNGDAKLLAVIIVVFSGIWPYLKNLILAFIWYYPTTRQRQSATLLWLSRLSKYTLVDVFAVVGVLVGVQLQLNVGGTEAVTRAEPRFGIIAFFLATVWEFLQIEWVKARHERHVAIEKGGGGGDDDDDAAEEAGGEGGGGNGNQDRLLFSSLLIPALLLAASVGLYAAGASSVLVRFSSSDSTGTCDRSYDLASLGNALIGDASVMTGNNSAAGQTWVLYLSYVVLVLAFPVATHVMQICFVTGRARSRTRRGLIEWACAVWCFACIEVLLIGIFAVEYKFPNLVMKIAGDSNAAFLDVNSELGPGFYILIVYSLVADSCNSLSESAVIRLYRLSTPRWSDMG